MKLSVIERVLLGGMMAEYKGDFVTLKLIREGREAISFNDEENKKLGFAQNGSSLSWNPTAAEEIGEVEVKLNDAISEVIKKLLIGLNDQRQLTENHFSLYEKFIH